MSEVVCIPIALSKSIKGRYFAGQTETLILGEDSNSWGGLINPPKSGVNIFVNVYTVTNFSDIPFSEDSECHVDTEEQKQDYIN